MGVIVELLLGGLIIGLNSVLAHEESLSLYWFRNCKIHDYSCDKFKQWRSVFILKQAHNLSPDEVTELARHEKIFQRVYKTLDYSVIDNERAILGDYKMRLVHQRMLKIYIAEDINILGVSNIEIFFELIFFKTLRILNVVLASYFLWKHVSIYWLYTIGMALNLLLFYSIVDKLINEFLCLRPYRHRGGGSQESVGKYEMYWVEYLRMKNVIFKTCIFTLVYSGLPYLWWLLQIKRAS